MKILLSFFLVFKENVGVRVALISHGMNGGGKMLYGNCGQGGR